MCLNRRDSATYLYNQWRRLFFFCMRNLASFHPPTFSCRTTIHSFIHIDLRCIFYIVRMNMTLTLREASSTLAYNHTRLLVHFSPSLTTTKKRRKSSIPFNTFRCVYIWLASFCQCYPFKNVPINVKLNFYHSNMCRMKRKYLIAHRVGPTSKNQTYIERSI